MYYKHLLSRSGWLCVIMNRVILLSFIVTSTVGLDTSPISVLKRKLQLSGWGDSTPHSHSPHSHSPHQHHPHSPQIYHSHSPHSHSPHEHNPHLHHPHSPSVGSSGGSHSHSPHSHAPHEHNPHSHSPSSSENLPPSPSPPPTNIAPPNTAPLTTPSTTSTNTVNSEETVAPHAELIIEYGGVATLKRGSVLIVGTPS